MNEIERLKSIDVNGAIAQALREKLRQEKGCKWCDKNLRFECYLIDDDGHTASIADNVAQTVIADFCPMCGRRLEVEQDEA